MVHPGNRRLAVAACGFALLAGCANDSRRPNADPLIGGEAPLPARAETAATTPKSTVPPLPAASSATSNAALAGGAFQPLDPTRDMRIGTNDGNATAGTWRGPTGSAGAPTKPSQPVKEPAAPVQTTSQPKTSAPPSSGVIQAGGPPGASTDALMALLQARGATFQRLETLGDTGEWHYSCSVPHPNNVNIRRTYEARGSDPRSAMTAVLKQMDQEQR